MPNAVNTFSALNARSRSGNSGYMPSSVGTKGQIPTDRRNTVERDQDPRIPSLSSAKKVKGIESREWLEAMQVTEQVSSGSSGSKVRIVRLEKPARSKPSSDNLLVVARESTKTRSGNSGNSGNRRANWDNALAAATRQLIPLEHLVPAKQKELRYIDDSGQLQAAVDGFEKSVENAIGRHERAIAVQNGIVKVARVVKQINAGVNAANAANAVKAGRRSAGNAVNAGNAGNAHSRDLWELHHAKVPDTDVNMAKFKELAQKLSST